MSAVSVATTERELSAAIPANGEVFARPRMHPMAVLARRATHVVTDALMLLGVVLLIPAVILAVGIPIALVLQLLLWIGRLL
jgi:hypothetical protein